MDFAMFWTREFFFLNSDKGVACVALSYFDATITPTHVPEPLRRDVYRYRFRKKCPLHSWMHPSALIALSAL